ncbi:PLD nuclease N-terminal domain-containing protein [Microbacterium sp. NPDC090225]|uniref:PLD nuclease N-terminal domain-containing protein n=1 Tax=Microbacterium sp. NPDC090225 TaxID=3364207 RepID=UPI00381010CE
MDANPLVPAAYDIVFSLVWLVVCAYAVVALVSAVRDRRTDGIRFLLWFLIIVLLPVIGPTAWFVIRPREGEGVSENSAE